MSQFEECVNKTSPEIEWKKPSKIINQTLSFQLWKLKWGDFREAWFCYVQEYPLCMKLQLVWVSTNFFFFFNDSHLCLLTSQMNLIEIEQQHTCEMITEVFFTEY